MDAAPVIARGHNVVVFVPPVAEAALAVIRSVTRRPLLILVSDAVRAAELSDGLPASFAVTGLERAALRLAADRPEVVACGAAEALALLGRSALQPAAFGCVVLAWPEQLDEEGEAALASVMSECDKDAQRLVLTARSGAATDALVARYAFKAMPYGFAAAGSAPAPVGPARYVIGMPGRMVELERQVLDALHAERDEEVVVAPCPADREAAQRLVERAGAARPPVIVAQPHQLAWLRTLFDPLTPLALRGAADLAETAAERLRARIAGLIAREDLGRELLTLGPLLARFDPAQVAAAALRLASREREGSGPAPQSGTRESAPGTASIWVGAGRSDGVGPGDLVGAIVNEAGVSADAIGRIDLRDRFCLVEVRADLAEQVARGLTGRTLRGRRLVARLDRKTKPRG